MISASSPLGGRYRYSLLDLLLFPTGFFLVLSVAYLDLPFLPVLLCVFVGLILYWLRFSLTLGNLCRNALLGILHLFFREVGARGLHKLPPDNTPTLLACAPHVNQFVDPICVMSITDRPVRFLCAAWSMRQPCIGDIARALQAIPVERAMDIAKQGPGRVTISGKEVTGDGQTDFIASGLAAGWSLLVREESLVVERVVDAHHLLLQHPSDRGDFTEPQSYFFAPRIDQAQVFANVWDSLGAGDCVGIFPEGGSHDQSAFLPFKAGVAVMALGACAQHPNLPLRILPVGLNYFQGWKFRSRVYLDIGDAIVPSQQQIDGYKAGGEKKKAAISELLEQVHHGLKLVTATAPSYEVLHLLWAIRRLYTPDDVRLTVRQKLELTRRFEQYYDRMKETPEGKELRERVISYNDKLALLGLRDHQLKAAADVSRPQLLTLLLQRVTMLLALTVAALPGGLLNLPTVIVARIVSARKAKQAIAEGMGIKLEGKDVMATWKVMTAAALVPLCLIIYPALAAVIGRYSGLGALRLCAATVLLQLPLMYASVRFVEVGWDVLRSLKPLWFALTGHAGVRELRQERAELQARIRAMVDLYGPKLYGSRFQEERVIKNSEAAGEQKEEEEQQSDRGFERRQWIRLRSRKELGLF